MFSKISKISSYLKPLRNPLMSSVRHYPYPLNFLYYLQNEPPLEVTQLDNGLTVSTLERNLTDHACLAYFIPAGARYERGDENGLTSFFQRIAFKATHNRNHAQLQDDMNAIGARFKCFCNRGMTVFYVACLAQDIAKAINILTSVIFYNALDDIPNQKRVVYQEMLEHEKNTNGLVYDLLHEAAYQDTPLAQTILGKTSYLNEFNEDKIKEYLRRRYSPVHSHLVCVGKLTHTEMVCLAQELIGNLEPTLCAERKICRFTSAEVRFRDDSLPLANVTVAVEGPSFGHGDTNILQIMSEILGSWDRSMPGGNDNAHSLAQFGLEGRVVGYKPLHITYHDCSLWGIQYLAPRFGVDDFMLHSLDEFMRFIVLLHENELARGKHSLKTKLLTRTESAVGMCMDIGKWMLYTGCWPALHEQIKAIDSVRLDELKKVSDHYLYDRGPAMAAVGPTEELSDMVRVRSGFYWLRY